MKEEEEDLVTVCVWCNEIVEEFPSIEVAICSGCGCVEGDTKEITEKQYDER